MKLVSIGITHHNCPIRMREKLSFAPDKKRAILRRLHTIPQVSEAVILETCNRTEFYLYAKKTFDCVKLLKDLIKKHKSDAVRSWNKYSHLYEGIEAIRHLFAVAAGLDSQMVGEGQILSQLKSAYTESINCRMSKLIFHRLFHNAFRVGKTVRTKTSINCGAVSIALAAFELAKKKVNLAASKILLIGAGQNSQIVAEYIIKAQPEKLIVANRSTKKAKAAICVSAKAQVIPLRDIKNYLSDIDLIISSTASQKPILTYNSVKNILARRKRRLLIIDIAVPRDIDTRISRFKSVALYNIDDLKEQIKINKQKRLSEIPKAQAIVNEFTDKFAAWLASLDVAPVISKLNQKALEIAHRHAARYAGQFAKNAEGDIDKKLNLFAESLAKKLMHGPISFLKQTDKTEPATEQLQAADLINKVFLSEPDKS